MIRHGMAYNTNTALYVYADGKDDDESYANIKSERIANEQYLIAATSGAGKSNLVNLLAWTLKKHGYTIIYLSEKSRGGEFENAFCAFPPRADFHAALLERHNQDKDGITLDPLPLPAEPQTIRIHHPFTFNLPSKLPDCVTPFTLPITSLSDEALSAILAVGSSVDSVAVRMCKNTLGRLDPTADVFLFLRTAFAGLSDVVSYSRDPRDMGIPVGADGTMREMERSVSSFSMFYEDHWLQPESGHTLDMVGVLNDQATTHFFSTRWIKDEREKYVVNIQLLAEIDRALESGKVKHPLCVIIEEVKILLPRSTEVSYQNMISDKLRVMLAGLRNKGRGVSTIATTQNYMQTNIDYRSGCTKFLLGRLHLEDIKAFVRDFSLKREQQEAIWNIRKFEWLTMEDVMQDIPQNPIRAFICPFALKEEKEKDFVAVWKEVYAERMTDLKPLMAAMKERREAAWATHMAWLAEQESKAKKRKADKEARKRGEPVDDDASDDDTDEGEEGEGTDTPLDAGSEESALPNHVPSETKVGTPLVRVREPRTLKEAKTRLEAVEKAHKAERKALHDEAMQKECYEGWKRYCLHESWKGVMTILKVETDVRTFQLNVLRHAVRKEEYANIKSWFKPGFVKAHFPEIVPLVKEAIGTNETNDDAESSMDNDNDDEQYIEGTKMV